ncbi:hypothetical protein Godav_010228, partial [Gossypium davidsonii]|nr:hypothetical protein [Gossypium davidsonii]MBA0660506.1 hypothetical protein [Gossypium klotzschianum]
MLKLGLQQDAIKFSTLINGFCNQIKISLLIAYNTMLIKLLEVMVFEALDTTDTMNKQVIARYVSKAEDIVDTMIKRDIEQ